ncbi:MAG: MFS transporter [Nostoc sp. LLA-1]|nr:MFS transporter [Cyanocohniella sp. LLY]
MFRDFFQLPPVLKSPNVSCFVIGESVSFFGSWMTKIALVWIVYQLTNSAMLVGVVGFTNQIMSLVITPLVGVLLDRWNLKYVLLITQITSIVLSGTLAFLTFNGHINVTWIIVIGTIQGTVKAFDLPARLVTIPRLVDDKTDAYGAIAIHSFLMNTAKFVSPMVGGFLIARYGGASCFLVDSLSYFPFILAILNTRIKTVNNNANKERNFLKNLKEGFNYSYSFVPLRYVLILKILVCFMAMTHVNLLPIFVSEVLNGNAETMGFLMTASALGSIIAGLYLVMRKKATGLGEIIVFAAIILGLSLILFSRSSNLELCLLIIFVVGMTNSLTLAAIGNFVQLILADENKRGRVTSIFTTAVLGILPLGNLFFGALASRVGVANALLFGGVCCLTGAGFFARKLPEMKKIVSPIYIKMGLIQ